MWPSKFKWRTETGKYFGMLLIYLNNGMKPLLLSKILTRKILPMDKWYRVIIKRHFYKN